MPKTDSVAHYKIATLKSEEFGTIFRTVFGTVLNCVPGDLGAGQRGRPDDVPADLAIPAGAAEGAGTQFNRKDS